MSNKAHRRPHRKKRQARRTTGLLVVILLAAIVALVTAMAASGHAMPAGRIIPLRGGRCAGPARRARCVRSHTGAAAPDPAAYGLSPPLFQPLTAYAAHGRIFPAPARGNPAPRVCSIEARPIAKHHAVPKRTIADRAADSA